MLWFLNCYYEALRIAPRPLEIPRPHQQSGTHLLVFEVTLHLCSLISPSPFNFLPASSNLSGHISHYIFVVSHTQNGVIVLALTDTRLQSTYPSYSEITDSEGKFEFLKSLQCSQGVGFRYVEWIQGCQTGLSINNNDTTIIYRHHYC